MAKPKIIAALDVGTDTIKLAVVKQINSDKDLEVLAQVVEPSFGVRRGVIVNIDSVSKIIDWYLTRLEV